MYFLSARGMYVFSCPNPLTRNLQESRKVADAGLWMFSNLSTSEHCIQGLSPDRHSTTLPELIYTSNFKTVRFMTFTTFQRSKILNRVVERGSTITAHALCVVCHICPVDAGLWMFSNLSTSEHCIQGPNLYTYRMCPVQYVYTYRSCPVQYLYACRTCPVQYVGRARTNLRRVAGRDPDVTARWMFSNLSTSEHCIQGPNPAVPDSGTKPDTGNA